MAHPTPDDLALAALGDDADLEVREHVGGCRTCLAEVEALQHVVAVGRSLGPADQLSTPNPRVWQQIAAEVHGQVGSQAGSVSVLAARRRPASRRRWAPVALAAAAALVVGLGGGYALRSATGPSSDATSAAPTAQLNALPGWPGANGRATLEEGADGHRSLVVNVQLSETTDVDGTMEVWMSDTQARDMVPMGTMTGDSARFPVPASFDLASHPVVDVSMEPRNDRDPHHSDVSVVRGRLNV